MSIGCIIIVYKKDINFLLKNIINIYADIDNFYIINNSEKKIKILKDKKINIINLDVNLGIAAAQNIALNLSYKNKNDYILFKTK